jgi:hypothetical protein
MTHNLTNLKILIAVPTYKRAGNVPTLDLFDEPVLFVDSFEMDAYRKAHPNATIVEYVGNPGLTPKLNFILKYARENKYDAIIKVDDDFREMAYYGDGIATTYRGESRERIYQVCERLVVMAKDANIPLFSFLQIGDVRKFNPNSPFSLFATLKLGIYGMLVDNDLWFDERFKLKQDIDMCLQVLMKYRKVLIENRYSFHCKPTMGNPGGCSDYRNRPTEDKIMELLRSKWGSKSFNDNDNGRVGIYTLNIKNPFS